jgi:hypothetical protein
MFQPTCYHELYKAVDGNCCSFVIQLYFACKMLIKSFVGYFYRGYLYMHTCRGFGVSVICNNELYWCVIYLRDGYVTYRYSVSVIVILLTFFGELVYFLFAVWYSFGCFVQWFCRRRGIANWCSFPAMS